MGDGEVGAIEQLVKLNHLVLDPLVEWSHRRDALVVIKWWHLGLRKLFVVQVRIHLESIYKAFLGHVASVSVNHGQSSSSAND